MEAILILNLSIFNFCFANISENKKTKVYLNLNGTALMLFGLIKLVRHLIE